MTKITVLGESVAEKPKKKIEIIGITTGDGYIPFNGDSKWDNIVLIRKNYEENMDLLLCFDDNEKDGNDFKYRGLFLGYFNDGVV